MPVVNTLISQKTAVISGTFAASGARAERGRSVAGRINSLLGRTGEGPPTRRCVANRAGRVDRCWSAVGRRLTTEYVVAWAVHSVPGSWEEPGSRSPSQAATTTSLVVLLHGRTVAVRPDTELIHV